MVNGTKVMLNCVQPTCNGGRNVAIPDDGAGNQLDTHSDSSYLGSRQTPQVGRRE